MQQWILELDGTGGGHSCILACLLEGHSSTIVLICGHLYGVEVVPSPTIE
jgi:hypothetical protein